MGRPRKSEKVEETMMSSTMNTVEEITARVKGNLDSMAVLPPIHNMIRTLNAGTPDPNAQRVEEVDAEVGVWLEKGYRLFNTHFLGTEIWQGDASKKGIVVLYVLVKD